MSNSEAIGYSIVVPVFNAAHTIDQLYSELFKHLSQIGKPFEIIFVDDCSIDDSWIKVKNLACLHTHVHGLQLMRNSGQGAATIAGLAQSRGNLVMTMDDDLQNPPHEVPRLFRYIEEHPDIDVVFGCPRNKNHALWRRVGSTMVNRLSNIMFNQEANFKLTSFRVIRREVIHPLLRLHVPEPPIGALLSTLTKRLANLEVDHSPRVTGISGYSIRALMRVTLSKFLGFSTFPLRLLASMGLIGISLSILLGFYFLYQYLFGNTEVQGWTTLVLLLLGLSGFTFLAFGIIGEYLQQILISARRSPPFVLRTTDNAEPENTTEVVTKSAQNTKNHV
ncbi:MAG: glycosyltransferase family 2 protein [Kordiimonadaceae bacterium]|nr:glycosyltransferase family 2 protein [Kordiimonadaceae bacterium]